MGRPGLLAVPVRARQRVHCLAHQRACEAAFGKARKDGTPLGYASHWTIVHPTAEDRGDDATNLKPERFLSNLKEDRLFRNYSNRSSKVTGVVIKSHIKATLSRLNLAILS